MSSRGSTVLVVDDDGDIRDLLTLLLEAEGYTVVHAHHGEAALAILAALRPDAVLLDLLMPDIGGMDVLRHLHHTGRLDSLPVIVLSAHADGVTVAEAEALGAYAFLAKPFRSDQLLDTLRAAVSGA